VERILQAVKGFILGSPFATSQIVHERLTKLKALAIFSSDALSSSAYATEEILLVLVLAGSGSLHDSIPIAIVIAALIGIVTLSYRQTIGAYPGGGGAYIVAYTNLGRLAGLVAGAALLVDYTLTVSVSTAAGVAAVTSAIPSLHDARVLIGLAVIAAMTLGNLRGIREAGTMFAVPTYFFILSMSAVIIIGFVKVVAGDAPGTLTNEPEISGHVDVKQGMTLFLILRAFSSGCAALTGIEAISNGVPAFKRPEVPNARTTMAYMAAILGFLFLGITFLANRFALVPTEAIGEEPETIVSQLGRVVLGQNPMYYAYQVGTALVLFLAANTSYSAFPPLGANLARDRFLPRQFSFRGDRLAYSNGIIILSIAAMALLVAFQADVNKLIPLYALGVFISFTLSQVGMVIHSRREKGAGWQTALLVSALGAIATAVVAVIIGISKFTTGAYISILMMLAMMAVFALIRRHYDWYAEAVAITEAELAGRAPIASPAEPSARRDHAVIPVDEINRVTVGAIELARAVTPDITAVHLTDSAEDAEEFRLRWSRLIPDVPLLIIESPYRAFAAPMLAYIEGLVQIEGDRRITVILPAFKAHHWYERVLHNQAIRRLKPFLDDYPNVNVVEFDYDVRRKDGAATTV
jgi:amino acid transporter